MGRCEEGLAHLKRAHQLDPVSPAISAQIALSLLCARRYEEAIAQCSLTLDAEPACDEARVCLMMSYVQAGMPEAAIAEYERMTPASGKDTTTSLRCWRTRSCAGRERAQSADTARGPHRPIALSLRSALLARDGSCWPRQLSRSAGVSRTGL